MAVEDAEEPVPFHATEVGDYGEGVLVVFRGLVRVVPALGDVRVPDFEGGADLGGGVRGDRGGQGGSGSRCLEPDIRVIGEPFGGDVAAWQQQLLALASTVTLAAS